jgi:FkbM family methyltransferase
VTALAARIVGTPIGRAAKVARSKCELLSAKLESIGTTANDQLAEYLVTRFPERHFVDVGAHIGGIIAEVIARCPGVQITAIEPIPAKVNHLRTRFPNVSVIETALSDEDGEARFFVNPRLSGYSSLNPDAGTDEIAVRLKRLDSLVADPDVIKIDVEGAELGVLRGCENLKTRPLYMFESAPGEVLGFTKTDLWSWFQAHDYAIFLPNRLAHTAAPMSMELFLDSHEYPRRATNYFAVPNEDVERARNKARKLLGIAS